MPKQPVCTHLGIHPKVAKTAFVASNSTILGDVTIGEKSSVWYQSVLRADIESIHIGEGSNLQDGVIVHLASDIGTQVGDYVTVGHRALLHACHIEDEVLVGMGAIIMDGAHIGARSIVAAGSIVTKDKVIPPGSLVMGSPAKVVRKLPLDQQSSIRDMAEKYICVAAEHRAALDADSPSS
ncbi:UNVERIFIED_CONTAM: hypothetical protein GTU68_006782 [Idotea baltica]|nr:hypothetical protein [Idotea baltica]